MLILGHRGIPAHAPENSMKGFHLALEKGADGLEFDVRLSADGVPVVFHDVDLKRTTNEEGKVAETALEELKTLDIGDGERMPTLQGVLQELPKCQLFIEIKAPEAAAAVAGMVKEYSAEWGVENLVVISFDPRALIEVKNILPNAHIGITLMHGFRQDAKNEGIDHAMGINFEEKTAIDDLLRATQQLKPNWVNFKYKDATKELVELTNADGIKTTAWTCNNQESITHAKNCGIDAIMTDDIGLLV